MVSRQLGIVYLLMKKKNMTASELAARYEVSVRTIYRDVEALSIAGIPIYARKGKNGGISLTEQFVFDKLLVSEKEQKQILAALTSLDEIGAQEGQSTLKKLGDFFKVEPKNWVAVDFSDWSGRRQELYEEIKQAILFNHVLTFDYYGQYSEMSQRTVEPRQLLFKEYTWYLSAFCRDRQAMRLFKVLRMKRVKMLPETFQPGCGSKEEAPAEKLESNASNMEAQSVSAEGGHKDAKVTIHIAASEAYRVYDRFEEEEITVLASGDFLINTRCSVDDWVYGMLLSFGPSAELLSPKYMREEMKKRIGKMLTRYE